PPPGRQPGRRRPWGRPRCTTSIQARLTGPGRYAEAGRYAGIGRTAETPGRTGLTRPAQRASRLAGPVRPGAGGDAGRVPPATAAGAVDNRAGPRPHPPA